VRSFALALASLAALGAAVAAAPRAWRALHEAPALRVRTVRFSGLSRSTADELLALSPVKPGDPFLFADLPSLEAALARHPWVKRATARRTLPPAIEVAVEERVAAALVDLGGLYLVDAAGDVFKRAAAGDGLDLPLVTGLARADYVQRRAAAEPLLLGALALARAWPDRAQAQLSEIHVDPGDGVTLYVGEEGTQVRLGTGDYEAKLGRLEKVLSALRAEGKRAEVVHLDNRLHPSWVTVRLASAGGSLRAQGQTEESAPERVGGMGGRRMASPHVGGGSRDP
jgi:cell division protein FtsQ